MKPQYPSTQNNETMMKCHVRKSVIFSSNVLVTFHSHVSVETVVIPYPPRAEHWNLEDLSPASRSAKPRCATRAIANAAPCASSCGARQKELWQRAFHGPFPSPGVPEIFQGCSLKFLLAPSLSSASSLPFHTTRQS